MTGFSANKRGQRPIDRLLCGLAFFTVVLMAVTVINQFLIDPYEPVADPIIVVGSGAIADGSRAPVVLSTARPGDIIRRDFRIANPKAASHFRVRADIRLRGVKPGNRRWKLARILFNQVHADGTLYWEPPHVVFRGKGDIDAPQVETVLAGSPVREFVNLRVELLLAQGEMRVNGLSIVPSRLSAGAARSEQFLLVAWICLITAWSLCFLLKNLRRSAMPFIAICWLAAMTVMGLSTLPSGSSQPIFHFIWSQVTWVESRLPDFRAHEPVSRARVVTHAPAGTLSPANETVRVVNVSAEEAAAGRFTLSKIAHVGVFVGIGALFALYASGLFWTTMGAVVMFSLITELMQTFAINRSPSLFDAGLNTGGAMAGAVLMTGAVVILRRMTARH